MKNSSVVITVLLHIVVTFQNVSSRPAELDSLIGHWRHFRLEAFKALNETVESMQNVRLLRKQGKVQTFVRKKYPCLLNNTRSAEVPESVHKLRPGDIDVVAGIGDSLTAGVGLMATNGMQVSLEHRGIAPTAGGKGSWRKYLTLPNILKTFNPSLTGYATETSLTLHPQSQLNLGETGAMSEDMPYMTKELIKRMMANPKIDVNKHWKMVTFMIGPNNFCSEICYEEDVLNILEKHRKDLRQVLTILKENLPRTVVNLLPAPDLKILIDFTNKSFMCEVNHLIECPCLFGPASKNRQEVYIKLMEQWQNIDLEIGNSNEFDSDNFTVVVQPFTLNFFIPNTKSGTTDYSYLSEDCFHMSQKGNARIANSLWNNIMEPVGMKARKPFDLFQEIKCPSQEHPFIFTRRNSNVMHKDVDAS